MNITNLKIKSAFSLILIFSPLLFLVSCENGKMSELSISSVELCDNFDAEVNCTEPKDAFGSVKLKTTSTGKEKTSWENFSNYLYFTARETPGFVITFSRAFTEEEKKTLSSNYIAYLSLNGVREKMEGFEMGKDKIASFHYLGSLLKEVKRKENKYSGKPNLTTEGNLLLQFEFTLPNGESRSLQREVKLEWAE